MVEVDELPIWVRTWGSATACTSEEPLHDKAEPRVRSFKDRGDFASGLKAIKRMSGLTLEAIRHAAPRDVPLGPSTVQGWLSGRHLPSATGLRAFLTVCGVMETQHASWLAALDRVRRGSVLQTIEAFDPILELGVHPAIEVQNVQPGSNLPPYALRDHDERLRSLLRDGTSSELIVLVGGSAVGKTRACLEGVREVLPDWPVHTPRLAEDLLALLREGIAPGYLFGWTRLKRYLQPPLGDEIAGALQALLRHPVTEPSKRVIFLGTMWRRPFWQSLSYPAESGDVDRSSEVRKLLQMCSSIDAVEDFRSINDNQRIELHRLADEDPRLAMAVATSGEDAQYIYSNLGWRPMAAAALCRLIDNAPYCVRGADGCNGCLANRLSIRFADRTFSGGYSWLSRAR